MEANTIIFTIKYPSNIALVSSLYQYEMGFGKIYKKSKNRRYLPEQPYLRGELYKKYPNIVMVGNPIKRRIISNKNGIITRKYWLRVKSRKSSRKNFNWRTFG